MKCDILVGSNNLLSLKLSSEDCKRFKLTLLNDQIKVVNKSTTVYTLETGWSFLNSRLSSAYISF